MYNEIVEKKTGAGHWTLQPIGYAKFWCTYFVCVSVWVNELKKVTFKKPAVNIK